MTTNEFEKWIKDGVTGRLAKTEDIPAAAVAQARQSLAFAAKDPELWKDPKACVAAVCRGTLGGLILLDQDITGAAVPLTRNILEASQDCHMDPAETIGGALEGIAKVAAMLPAEAQNAIRDRIDEAFMGTGTMFVDFLHQASSK